MAKRAKYEFDVVLDYRLDPESKENRWHLPIGNARAQRTRHCVLTFFFRTFDRFDYECTH